MCATKHKRWMKSNTLKFELLVYVWHMKNNTGSITQKAANLKNDHRKNAV